MFFYIVLTPISFYEVPAIRVNTSKSTYTLTSVILGTLIILVGNDGFGIAGMTLL